MRKKVGQSGWGKSGKGNVSKSITFNAHMKATKTKLSKNKHLKHHAPHGLNGVGSGDIGMK